MVHGILEIFSVKRIEKGKRCTPTYEAPISTVNDDLQKTLTLEWVQRNEGVSGVIFNEGTPSKISTA